MAFSTVVFRDNFGKLSKIFTMSTRAWSGGIHRICNFMFYLFHYKNVYNDKVLLHENFEL